MLNFVIQALDGIFTIAFVVAIGYVLSKKGWFDDKSSALIAKLVTTISLPLYMITSLTKNFTAAKLVELAPDMLMPVCSMILAMFIGKILVSSSKCALVVVGYLLLIFLSPILCSSVYL